MDDVEERILAYPHLPVDEKREVEAYVEANPAWAPLLRDVRSLEYGSVFSTDGELPDALIPTFVVIESLGADEAPPALQAAFDRLKVQIQEDEELRDKVETARTRLREAEARIDPTSRFEELTSYKLAGASSREDRHETVVTRGRQWSVVEVFRTLPRLARGLTIAAAVLAVVYGGLFQAGRMTQSTVDRLAAVDVSDQVIEDYTSTKTRSPGSNVTITATDSLYLEALSSLRNTRTATLGLFPRYDYEELRRSEELLSQVVEKVAPESFLALEARFYLGKVALAQQQLDVARKQFETVVDQQGRKADDAKRILDALEEEK